MVALATLSDSSRRLLNTVFDHPHVRVGTALLDADCGIEELDPLARQGLLIAEDDDGEVDVPGTPAHVLQRAWLSLTKAGEHWANTDPENLFLRTLDAMTRAEGKLQLRKALNVTDRHRIRVTVEQGYATVHDDVTLTEVGFRGRGRHEFAHASEYALVATPKIRRVLGPR